MMDLSGYVKQPCIRLEPNGSEPAEVYCKKYAALYKEIAERLNGGKSIGTLIHDASGMYLLSAEVEDREVTFGEYNQEKIGVYDQNTNTVVRGLPRVRPFSILEKIANAAGFMVRVEEARSFMEEKYCYQPKPENTDYDYKSLSGASQNPASSIPQRKPSNPAFPAVQAAVGARGRTTNTLEMSKVPISEDRLIGYQNKGTDTLIAAKQESSIPQGYQLSQALQN